MLTKRQIIRLLDRPGGRSILSYLATMKARSTTRADVEVFYDKLWIHRSGNHFFPDGEHFDYNSGIYPSWLNEYEQRCKTARDYWYQFYKPSIGDTIIDIGAGRGEDITAFAQDVGGSGRVIAIEAHPKSYTILEQFCRLNKFNNVTTLNYAIMDKSGSVTISDDDTWEANTVSSNQSLHGYKVSAITLDLLCSQQNIKNIAFLKMNIEGAELFALPGLIGVISRINTICIACHDFRADLGHGESYRTRVFVESFLEDHGFHLRSRADHHTDYVRDHIFGVRIK
jgi:FkbM family methyltransferase